MKTFNDHMIEFVEGVGKRFDETGNLFAIIVDSFDTVWQIVMVLAERIDELDERVRRLEEEESE